MIPDSKKLRIIKPLLNSIWLDENAIKYPVKIPAPAACSDILNFDVKAMNIKATMAPVSGREYM